MKKDKGREEGEPKKFRKTCQYEIQLKLHLEGHNVNK